MTVKFRSDKMLNLKGFRARFIAGKLGSCAFYFSSRELRGGGGGGGEGEGCIFMIR